MAITQCTVYDCGMAVMSDGGSNVFAMINI